MLFSLVIACSGSSSSTPEPAPGDAPLIPTAAPAPPPEPPPGPLPKIGPADKLVVEFSSDDVDGGPVALACSTGPAVADCAPSFGPDVWAVGVAALSDDPSKDTAVVIPARAAQVTSEQGPQCTWLRVHAGAKIVKTASAPRPIHAVTQLPAVLAAAPPRRAWSIDLDGDGADEILYEQTAPGATNTIGVVKADGTKVVVWQDEAVGPAAATVDDEQPVGSTGGSWSTLVGLTDANLDGKLEIVLDLDRHETFGWTLFSYGPTGAAKVATANCKVSGKATTDLPPAGPK